MKRKARIVLTVPMDSLISSVRTAWGCQAFGLLALAVLAGCGRSEPMAQTDYPIEAEVAKALQGEGLAAAGRDDFTAWSSVSTAHPPAPSVKSNPRTRLASFANRSRRPVKLQFGGFGDSASRTNASASATRLVQAPAAQSESGGVEIVPAPEAQPELKGELVPTPAGERDSGGKSKPIARIAADMEKSDGKGGSKDAGLGSAAKESVPSRPELIDPNSESALVGAADGPEDFTAWKTPEAVIFVTGNQHGYIEPCGCTGLENQKGGVARRFTLMKQLRDKGWPLVPIDAGNQIRRIGRQASIKFEKSASALSQMKYQSVGFGPSDMRLTAGTLIAIAYADSPDAAMFIAGNIVLLDPQLVPSHKVVRQGEWKIGLTTILDPDALEAPTEDDVQVKPMKEAAASVLKEMNAAGANFRVMTFFGKESAAEKLMGEVPGFDLIIVSGGYGEPTYRPQAIEGSKTKMIVTGAKGMYAGLVGLYQNEPMKYARVPLTHDYDDAPEMRALMAEYQQQLEQLGLNELGLSPIKHPSREKFVGSKACGKCHTTAYEIWESSAHEQATEHIVKPPQERGDIARHFDPECISCHVTGWNAQDYQPYESGYWDLKSTAHLTGNGCENCHGPGASHSAAEEEGSGVSDDEKESLREAMRLPLEDAKEQCMTCHDLDNSPDFHDEDAFEDIYWPEVEHYGLD